MSSTPGHHVIYPRRAEGGHFPLLHDTDNDSQFGVR